MKNTNSLCIILSILIISSGISSAEYSEPQKSNQSEYSEMKIDSSLNFQADRKGYEVGLKWTPYSGDDFQYYKVMRSETNSNPVYPEQGAIQVMDNQDIYATAKKDWYTGGSYYRICVITNQKGRLCSEVVKVDGFEKEDTYQKKDTPEKVKNYEKKDIKNYEKKDIKNYEKKPTPIYNKEAPSSLEKRADALAGKFIKKLEIKYSSNDQRLKVVNTVIDKLDVLGIQKPQLKMIIKALTKSLKEKSEKYNNDFDVLEGILNDL